MTRPEPKTEGFIKTTSKVAVPLSVIVICLFGLFMWDRNRIEGRVDKHDDLIQRMAVENARKEEKLDNILEAVKSLQKQVETKIATNPYHKD